MTITHEQAEAALDTLKSQFISGADLLQGASELVETLRAYIAQNRETALVCRQIRILLYNPFVQDEWKVFADWHELKPDEPVPESPPGVRIETRDLYYRLGSTQD